MQKTDLVSVVVKPESTPYWIFVTIFTSLWFCEIMLLNEVAFNAIFFFAGVTPTKGIFINHVDTILWYFFQVLTIFDYFLVLWLLSFCDNFCHILINICQFSTLIWPFYLTFCPLFDSLHIFMSTWFMNAPFVQIRFKISQSYALEFAHEK